ncbi:MAG: alpha/beta fold hydrolase [bacterium]
MIQRACHFAAFVRALLLLCAALPLGASLHAQADTTRDARFLGTWSGVLVIGVPTLRLVLEVTRSAGALTGTLESPDQGNARIPAQLAVQGDSLVVRMPMVGATFTGALTSAGDTLRGPFIQAGRTGSLAMAHVASSIVKVTSARPQEPSLPLPYRVTDVAFESVPGVRIAGTLTEPQGPGPFPAVVLVTGSGPQDRDEALMGHRPFYVLSDYLTRRGIAVLRSDDRGVAKSTGVFARATTADFANDAEAAVRFLGTRPEIAHDRIGIIGHSEGGMIAPMVAARSADVAFIVMMAGPGVRGDSLMTLQTRAQLRLGGASATQQDSVTAFNAQVFRAVASAPDSAQARARASALEDEFIASRPGSEQAALRTSLASGLTQLTGAWMRGLLRYDPTSTLMRVHVPVLAINGTLDSQVPYREDLDGIAAALKAGGNKDYEIVALPGLNHLFQTAKTGAVGEYMGIEETIAPAALAQMGDWIVRRFVHRE